MIDYDPSRDALYRPAQRPSVFSADASFSADAICAECSRLAYLHFESDAVQRQQLIDALALAGFRNWNGFNDARTGSEAFAAVRESSGESLIVFRGTEPGDITDLGTDLNVRPTAWSGGGSVHSGFAQAFDSLRPQLEAWLGSSSGAATLTVTGHSLGAALATLAMSAWRAQRLVTFGSPRVGDQAFVSTIDAASCVRYVDCCDIVCRVPPAGAWYADTAPMRYIDASGVVREAIDAAGACADRDRARLEYLRRYSTARGNVLIRDLADHAPINYVRALMATS